tara:strand:- start:2960 stop:3283 length:324 start_codon:yes stop_codon:yes gene_type:complete
MDSAEKKSICIDIDGTICSQEIPENYSNAKPIEGALEALQNIKKSGFNIILHTARHFNHWQTTKSWLKEHGFIYDEIVYGKPPAKYYIDDRSIVFDGKWDDVIDKIK